MRHLRTKTLLLLSTLCGLANPCRADDWPGWLGAQRDSVVRETGYVTSIPNDGLKVEWRAPIGGGYSGPSVAAGRVYVNDYQATSGKNTNNPGGRDERKGTERVLCFDAKSGKQIWEQAYERPYNISYSNGPRATPTVDGDQLFSLGAEGDLLCLGASDGKVRWKKSLPETYKTETPIWGYSAAPLVYGDLLITLAGGNGSVVVALNKNSGEEKWRALSASEIGYCAPSIAQVAGKPQLIIWHAEAINGLNPLTGEVIWSAPLKPSYAMSIAVPRVQGNKLFASGIGEVGAMFEIAADGKSVKELWRGTPKSALYSANAPALFVGNTLYGSDCGSGQFIAAKAEDGERLWQTFDLTSGGNRRASHGTAFIVKQAEQYWLFNEKGDLILAQLSPEGFKEIGRSHVIEPTGDAFGRPVVWTHPAFANQHAFIRNDKALISVNLAETK